MAVSYRPWAAKVKREVGSFIENTAGRSGRATGSRAGHVLIPTPESLQTLPHKPPAAL